MTELLVAPDLDTVLFERRGIFTVPAEDAPVRCWCTEGKPCQGVDIDKLPQSFHAFVMWAKQMGQMFIERQKPRGFEFPLSGAMRLHGPFPSYELNQHLFDVESTSLKEAMRRDKEGLEHPEKALDFVFERDAFSPYVDYVFVGNFLFKDRLTDLEVPSV